MEKKLLQINVSANSGSTGRIAEEIGKVWHLHGYKSYIAYGRNHSASASELIKVGSDWDKRFHGLKTRIFDLHGFGSGNATRELIGTIEQIKPDAILLHNLHGYYLNVDVLFKYIGKTDIPVIWTLYDCWPFTGHCCYFDSIGCEKWKTRCHHCGLKAEYPSSWLIDNSKGNFLRKKEIFTSLKNLVLVAHSEWLAGLIRKSFLQNYKVVKISNGVNLSTFKPTRGTDVLAKYHIDNRYVLGVATLWEKRKGLDDFLRLADLIDDDTKIVLVGLREEHLQNLPANIIAIPHTESIAELAALYTNADAFLNPTWEDNFPTTNIEALACGTPVVTYNTGGSPEAVDTKTGFVVNKGDVEGLVGSIKKIQEKGKAYYNKTCRERAVKLFNCQERYMDYKMLFDENGWN